MPCSHQLTHRSNYLLSEMRLWKKAGLKYALALARFGRIEAGVLDHGSLREINAYSLESYDCTTKLHAISPIGVVFHHPDRILSASTLQLQEKRGLKMSRLVKD